MVPVDESGLWCLQTGWLFGGRAEQRLRPVEFHALLFLELSLLAGAAYTCGPGGVVQDATDPRDCPGRRAGSAAETRWVFGVGRLLWQAPRLLNISIALLWLFLEQHHRATPLRSTSPAVWSCTSSNSRLSRMIPGSSPFLLAPRPLPLLANADSSLFEAAALIHGFWPYTGTFPPLADDQQPSLWTTLPTHLDAFART